VKELQ
jgi:DNA repair exonuclease SbcCD ATPase subunit